MTGLISTTKLPEFEYFDVKTLDKALDLLDMYKDQHKILSGGTDLLVELRHRMIHPKYIINIKNIPELNTLEDTGKELRIGAAVCLNEILDFLKTKKEYNVLFQALTELSDEAIRFRATIVGNIATASPAADSSGPLLVLRSSIEVVSKSRGKRIIAIKDFFTGVKKNCLEPDELITSIVIPKPIEGTRSRFMKMKRSSEDLAILGLSGLHSPQEFLLAFTAVAPTPILLDITQFMPKTKQKLNEETFNTIWKFIKPNLKPISDVRSGRDYRLHIAEIFTRKMIKELL
ncbi:MAG: FAD binding domain-containing protein [Candidatus Hodarchaeales archaeon]